VKKCIGIILMLLIVVGPITLLHAEGTTKAAAKVTYCQQIGDKAARGLNNVLFGWTELPKRVVDITKETNNPVWGLFAGSLQGLLKAMARTASGVSDVLTAPIDPDKAPFITPEINVE